MLQATSPALRSYATQADLAQSGPVFLRPWQLNWEPSAGLRGYCDPVMALAVSGV